MTHLFWKCQKPKNFWDNFSIWLQSCQILQPGSYLDMTTALGLTPDSCSFNLHINFCCLIAKNFIWICRSRECFPIHNNFLFYLRHIYQLENKTPRNTKKWKLFFSSLGLVSLLQKHKLVICAPTMSIYITFTPKKEKKNVKINNYYRSY